LKLLNNAMFATTFGVKKQQPRGFCRIVLTIQFIVVNCKTKTKHLIYLIGRRTCRRVSLILS